MSPWWAVTPTPTLCLPEYRGCSDAPDFARRNGDTYLRQLRLGVSGRGCREAQPLVVSDYGGPHPDARWNRFSAESHCGVLSHRSRYWPPLSRIWSAVVEPSSGRLTFRPRGPTLHNGVMSLDIVFDGPPGPESGRFVEVENQLGRSVNVGEWVHRPDGYWALRIGPSDITSLASDPTNGHR